MKNPYWADETQDFILRDVLDLAGYSDHGVVITMIDAEGTRLRLHLEISTGELLCERIASALEGRYG
ncbi:hypothetical protein NKH57_32580 [Mesorhizobium sp. M1050]|nr:hypothetical protein [Mesorhizobium sp. LNHC252B00]